MLFVNKKGVTKDQIKKQEELIIKQIIEELMDQNGGYTRPELNQILWIQIIRLPRTIYEWLMFNIDWVWRFYIQRLEYSELEQEYIVRKRLKMTERQWSSLDERAKNIYMVRKLWENEAWQQWQEVNIIN